MCTPTECSRNEKETLRNPRQDLGLEVGVVSIDQNVETMGSVRTWAWAPGLAAEKVQFKFPPLPISFIPACE